jgi:predicted transcriptional regulator
MEVVSLKVDKRVKEKMRKLAHVNWSEVIRRAIAAKIEDEEARLRVVDTDSLKEAASMTDNMRKGYSKDWSSTEEIRRWREARK